MVVLPAATALTMPVAVIVALAGVELVHVPPATVLANDVVVPVQAADAPVMVAGAVLTVTDLVA